MDAAAAESMDPAVRDSSAVDELVPIGVVPDTIVPVGIDAPVVDAAVDGSARETDGAIAPVVAFSDGCSCQLDRGSSSNFGFAWAIWAMFFVRGLRIRNR
jgi:hypothetical protein